MRLSRILLSEIIQSTPEFDREVDRLRDQGGTYIGSGDYGSVFLLNGKAVKVTTDEIEIEHAEILKGKSRIQSAKTPPIADNGMAVKIRTPCFIEPNVKYSKMKISNKAIGTAIPKRCLASTKFSNCPP